MPDQPSSDRLLTLRETAEYLRLGESTVRAYIAQGKLRCVRIGRFVRVPFREIEALLQNAAL